MEASEFKFSINELEEKFTGKDVTIVGNGETGQMYSPQEGENVWVINSGIFHTIEADIVFVMDDIEGPAWDAHRQKEQWMDMLTNGFPIMPDGSKKEVPVISTRAVEGFPLTVRYPLERVLQRFNNFGYFAETLSYMVAWAAMIKVRRLAFHGCDFWSADRRNQRATAEHWIGRYLEAGGQVMVNPGSMLLSLPERDGVNRHIDGFYGYTPEYFPIPIELVVDDARPNTKGIATEMSAKLREEL